MTNYILDKSFLLGHSANEIKETENLILCPALLYEVIKETKKEAKTNRQKNKKDKNIKALEKLCQRGNYQMCKSIRKILKFEMSHLEPIRKDKLMSSLVIKNKEKFYTSLKINNAIKDEETHVRTLACFAIGIASDESLSSIFGKKVSEIDNISIDDISPQKINQCFKYICDNNRISPNKCLFIDENWGSYFYCKALITLALYIRRKYSKNISEIKNLSKDISIIIKKHTSNFCLNKTAMAPLKKIKIYNSIVHDMLDHLYLIYAGLIGGIKTEDTNIKETAVAWRLSLE
ncbi:hypothetical protein [Zymobacter sp. IVIA_12111.31 C1]|uniref:hypothetical protein n=1 Tax=Zymobacter sp. IVIA_12111.31 C1 TaxID=3394854 RepID=UPI0039C0526B